MSVDGRVTRAHGGIFVDGDLFRHLNTIETAFWSKYGPEQRFAPGPRSTSIKNMIDVYRPDASKH